MTRVIHISALLLLASISVAQQPDVRVRILSLYQLSLVRVEPSSGATVTLTTNSTQRKLSNDATVRALASSVEISGLTRPRLTLKGDFKVASERTPAQHIRGILEISARENVLSLVAIIPVEQYVMDVLQGESAGDMPEEALKALAVAIRSYTTRFRERHKEDGFDFCDTTHCQYLRLDPQPAVIAAVKQTDGELLWDRGNPLAAYYHKDCGGRTEAAAAVWPDQQSPSLVSHADPYCVRAARAWRSEIARSDLDRSMAAAGLRVPAGWNHIAIVERTPSGRARMLQFGVGSSQPGVSVSASTLRFAVGRALGWSKLKGDWYEVTAQGDHFIFTGKGVGHGVGLCQTGATEMANRRSTYREILAFYYPGAVIGRSAQGIPWTVIHAESLDFRVANPSDIVTVRTASHSALEWAKQRSGLVLRMRPVVEVYPTVTMFRDATGEPGWIAASTRNERIRLQPANVLGDRFESVLRHEFLHMLIESNAKPNTPLWFREGLVVYLGGDPSPVDHASMSAEEIENAIRSRHSQSEMRRVYAQAAALVRDLDRQNGRVKIIEWLRNGLPEEIRRGSVMSGGHEVAR